MMSPLVSVVVPSYNHEKFLKERIDSILNQTFQDFELIILDDLSPDNSREIIETYRAHPKVSKIVYNEKNSGSTFFQWNKAIFELAQGEFIWIAESDDVAESNLLETLVPVLKNDPEIVLAYCQSARMDSDGNITGSWITHTEKMSRSNIFDNSFIVSGSDFVADYLIHRNTIPNASAIIFKKHTYKHVGGAVEDLKTNGDWDLWVKMALNGKIAYERKELNYFRYHSSSVIAKANINNSRLKLIKNLLEYDISLRFSINEYLKNHKIFYKKIYSKNKFVLYKNKFLLGLINTLDLKKTK